MIESRRQDEHDRCPVRVPHALAGRGQHVGADCGRSGHFYCETLGRFSGELFAQGHCAFEERHVPDGHELRREPDHDENAFEIATAQHPPHAGGRLRPHVTHGRFIPLADAVRKADREVAILTT